VRSAAPLHYHVGECARLRGTRPVLRDVGVCLELSRSRSDADPEGSPGGSRWPHLVTRLWAGFGLTTWMQTVGTTLVAVKWWSVVRVRLPAQDSQSAHRLLYFAGLRAWPGAGASWS